MHFIDSRFSFFSKIYIALIAFSFIPLFWFSLEWFTSTRFLEFLFWLGLTVILELNPIVFVSSRLEETLVTTTTTITISSILVLGIQGAILVATFGLLIAEILSRRPAYKAVFNAAQYGITVFISGWIFYALKQSPSHIPFNLLHDSLAVISLLLIHFIINTGLVSNVISLTSKIPFWSVFFHDIQMNFYHHISSSALGLSMAFVYLPQYPFLVFFFLPPLLLIDKAYRWYYALHDTASKTIRALATIVDKRDKYTAEHSSRVASYTTKINEYMKIPSELAKDIEIAATVHDLGKIGISDSIINKNASLTKEEYDVVKKHPEIAYELIKNLKPYEKSAIYVLHHHERNDGSSYPKGLLGDEIPLGAKIISVADAYDAMTTVRPYRNALTVEEAILELQQNSGTQFDSTVVDALTSILVNNNKIEEN